MGFGVEAYARQLFALLPRGQVWQSEPGSVLSRLLLAIADELARVDGRASVVVREWDPRTALETLAEWEAMLGLPDDCLDTIPETIGERRVAITARLASRGGQSRAFFIALAESLGYRGATVSEFSVLRAGFRAGDRCCGDAWAHGFQVNLPISEPGAGVIFRAGSRAGDRLSGYAQLDVHCAIRRAAPAHAVVLFAYT